MNEKIARYQAVLTKPVSLSGRVLLLITVFLIPLTFQFPLWKMAFQSNQYPDPLRLEIYINHLEGQKTPRRD
ncbi:MAG TPA: hypothetical protein ENJ62_08005, partial [Bryobacterales bacterium]|nr:hypothetical protein [Bryobacterales bacterium]